MPKELPIEVDVLRRLYEGEKLSTVEIAKLYGCTKATVRKKLVRAGIQRRSLGEAFAVSKTHTGNNPRRREASNWWRGGTKMQTGYRMLHTPGHPDADRYGYVMEHRLVAAATIGRALQAGEEVHHLNHDRLDNRPENLVVMTKSEHMAMHMRERHREGKIPYGRRK